MFVLKGILRAESQEKILIYLLLNGSGYGKSIAEFYDIPQNPVQKQLARLEQGSNRSLPSNRDQRPDGATYPSPSGGQTSGIHTQNYQTEKIRQPVNEGFQQNRYCDYGSHRGSHLDYLAKNDEVHLLQGLYASITNQVSSILKRQSGIVVPARNKKKKVS